MIGDQSIYQEIGKILLSESPRGAKKIMMTTFDLNADGTACSFKFHSIDNTNEKKWFIPEKVVSTELLTNFLFKLRLSYVENNQPLWSSCIFILDIETGKFEMDFKYPD